MRNVITKRETKTKKATKYSKIKIFDDWIFLFVNGKYSYSKVLNKKIVFLPIYFLWMQGSGGKLEGRIFRFLMTLKHYIKFFVCG